MAEVEATLEIAYNLDLVVAYLEDKELSRTKIKNAVGLSDASINAVIEFGCNSGFLSRGEYNYVKVIKPWRIPENIFYPIVKSSLELLWKSERYDTSEFYVEQTAKRDSKIAGPWTRPDLTLVSYKKFPWTIGHEFDVVTFEVKRPDSCNVLAVFEALSQVQPLVPMQSFLSIGNNGRKTIQTRKSA